MGRPTHAAAVANAAHCISQRMRLPPGGLAASMCQQPARHRTTGHFPRKAHTPAPGPHTQASPTGQPHAEPATKSPAGSPDVKKKGKGECLMLFLTNFARGYKQTLKYISVHNEYTSRKDQGVGGTPCQGSHGRWREGHREAARQGQVHRTRAHSHVAGRRLI